MARPNRRALPWLLRKMQTRHLRSADNKPLPGVRVRLTALLLPVIYPPRFSQTATPEMAAIPDGPLQSTGTSNDQGIVTLMLPQTTSIASINAEVEPNVFVTWMVYSSSSEVPENWTETLKTPQLRKVPIQLTNDGDNLNDLSVLVPTTPLGSQAVRIMTRHKITFDETGSAVSVIQNNAMVMMRKTSQKPTDRHLGPNPTSNSTAIEELNVVFRKGVVVTGRAVSGDDLPAANISFSMICNSEILNGTTDADGRFEVTIPPGESLLLPAGRSGYRTEKLWPGSVIPDKTATHDVGDVTLIRLKSLTGTVRNDAEQTVAGTRVSAFWDEPNLRNRRSMISRDELVTTDSAGEFSIPDIRPDAAVAVFAEADGAMSAKLQVVSATQLDKPLSLTISPSSAIAITGRVINDSGSGVGNLPVTLRHRTKKPLTEDELPKGTDVTQVTLVTDANGNFTTPKSLPPWGEYIAVIRPGSTTEAISGWKSAKAGELLSLPPIEDSQTAEVSGQILTVDGKPLAGARIAVLTSEGQAEARSGDDGSFRFERPGGRMPMLIAGADGYFANGAVLEGNGSSLKIHLPRAGELMPADKPKQSPPAIPAPWTIKQRQKLALKLVEDLKDVNERTRMQFDSAVARAIPDHILAKLDSIPPAKNQAGQMIRASLAMGLAADRPQEAMKLLEQLPAGPIQHMTLLQYSLRSALADAEQLQLLARLVQDARGMKEAQFRVISLGMAAERLLDLGQRESGEALLRETHGDA